MVNKFAKLNKPRQENILPRLYQLHNIRLIQLYDLLYLSSPTVFLHNLIGEV